MNSKKVLLIVAVLAVLFGAYQYFTRIDRSDPVSVANAFTKALKDNNTSKASGFMTPVSAEAWRTAFDTKMETLKSGAMRAHFEGIPATPGFVTMTPAKGAAPLAAGNVSLQSGDKSLILEMTQVDGKWYVAKAPI